MSVTSQNLSHAPREKSFLQSKEMLANKIRNRGDLPYVSVQRQLELLDQLCAFDLGRFLIERGGLNGYWTEYVIRHPEKKSKSPLSELETFLLEAAPSWLATQQRFVLFKAHIKNLLQEGCHFASIPCGMMADLLDLDYAHLEAFSLYGLDLDPEALALAQEVATRKGLADHCHFSVCNAWHVKIQEKFDLVTSNGLSTYERDHEKVIALYRQFYNALKSGGTLLTSFTTPPFLEKDCLWKMSEVCEKDALLQRIVFLDILSVKAQGFRTESQARDQLHRAGFANIEILYDKAHIFPTVIAKK